MHPFFTAFGAIWNVVCIIEKLFSNNDIGE
jgi:hypothetical protein